MQPLQKDGGEKRLRRVLLGEVSLASLPPIFLQGKNEQCVFSSQEVTLFSPLAIFLKSREILTGYFFTLLYQLSYFPKKERNRTFDLSYREVTLLSLLLFILFKELNYNVPHKRRNRRETMILHISL